MHAYILTRGIKHDLDRFITELQGKYLSYEYEKGKEKGMVQVAVRPIQLYEIVFPEEHLNTMMTTLFSDETSRGDLLTYAKRNKKYLWALRKILNAQPIPKVDKSGNMLPCYRKNIEIAGIGIKKDEYENGIEKL